MWRTVFISGTLIATVFSEMTSNYFCANMNPQPHIIIEQLMGIWYGIEIINHHEENNYQSYQSQQRTKTIPSCPIIHLSEDQTNNNGLHKDYNYGYNYGEGYGTYNHRTQQGRTQGYQSGYQNQGYNTGYNTDRYNNDRNNNDRYNYPQGTYRTKEEQMEYDRNTTYPSYREARYNTYSRQLEQGMRRLRLFWDENGSSTEYRLRYNVSRSGFWISEGPKNGSSLEPQFSHFAGTIQVIKAVGSHLVLTFCHQLPERQLYSVLLSRENRLDNIEIHGVHSLLLRRGLSTVSVKKVCNSCAKININISVMGIMTFWYLFYKLI